MAYRDNRSRKMNPALEPGSEAAANDPIYTGDAYASDVRPDIARKTVGGSFEGEKSVTARAYQGDSSDADGSANDEDGEPRTETRGRRERTGPAIQDRLEQAEQAASVSESLRGRMRGRQTRVGAPARAASGLKAAKAFVGWNVLWIVGVAYLWQLLFAIISLAGYTIHGYILDVQSNSWWGRFASVFVDFTKIIPGELLGGAFFVLNFILVMGLFIGLVLWYYLVSGLSVLRTTFSTLITASCLALSIMPVTNLFPWLLLWVVYMELLKTRLALTSLFSTDA